MLAFVFIAALYETIVCTLCYPISLYALSVLFLGIPDNIATAKMIISKNKFGARYLNDAKLRAKLSLYQSFAVNLIFVIFYTYTSHHYHSTWFGAVAVYDAILSFIRFILLKNVRQNLEKEWQTYRLCGF
ncbi:hypothetical protein Hs30E_05900 [Lactococcus hodotermopsidis]|uniref:Uncharacterized protein n=1 Tax=Pseudolactococcus hodotermopsidis TaxID=2709157 RepID=A0A6A0B9C7_9LACT|nr:hypothetical protein Hs30E_05900 [Lactococcus hodotermopsidis]